MNTAKLSYQNFVNELKKTLCHLIPKNVQMDIHPVLKNNSLHLDGLVLRRENCQMSPNFYLQEYYEQYMTGMTVQKLAKNIMESWNSMEGAPYMDMPNMTFGGCKDYIVYRLVNTGRNQELLNEIPHIPFLDLAVIFYYLVSQDKDGISSIRVSNGLMKHWGVNTEVLMEHAGRNTPRLFPACHTPISRMLEHMLFYPEQEIKNFQEPPAQEPYILTNSNGINGAAVWIYPQLLEQLADYFGSNLYILPSSIHELLILADDGQILGTDLLHMVSQVNRDCVTPEEILSDNVYYFDRKKQAVCVIENVE